MSAPALARPEPKGLRRVPRATPTTVLITGIALAVLVAAAVGADLIRPLDDGVALDNVLAPPSLTHPFGTDDTGRDVLALALQAMRVSLLIMVADVP